jgi:probable HAF family extracellular repeat protein
MQNLGTLRTDGTGFSRAYAVSADGSTVVGESETDDGSRRAFIWRTQMQDLDNLAESFQPLANDAELAVDNQQSAIGHLIDQTLLAEKETSRIRLGGWLTNTADTRSEDIGEQTNAIGTLTYGRGLDGKTTLGATVSISATDLGRNNFDPNTGYGASIWAEYSETGLARSGLQAGLAIGWGQVSSDITRGRDLPNVIEVEGDADLATWGARATVGHGFQNETWLITPSANIYYFDTKRNRYDESGADFLGSYESLSVDRTMASLELSGERKVSEKGILELTLGIEHDFDENKVTLNGQSDVPGQENFSIESSLNRRDTRAFLSSIYSYQLNEDATLSAVFRVGQAPYGSRAQMIGGIRFERKL